MLPPAGHVAPAWPSADGGDAQVLAPFRRLDPLVADAVLDLLNVAPDDWFIDFGCGDGGVLERALVRCDRVSGVELDPFLAAAARRRCPSAQVHHEPIGWTPPCGPTAGLWHQLAWASSFFRLQVEPWLSHGFRLVTVDNALPPYVSAAASSVAGPPRPHLLRLYVFPQTSPGGSSDGLSSTVPTAGRRPPWLGTRFLGRAAQRRRPSTTASRLCAGRRACRSSIAGPRRATWSRSCVGTGHAAPTTGRSCTRLSCSAPRPTEHGVEVLLSGWGGDEGISFNGRRVTTPRPDATAYYPARRRSSQLSSVSMILASAKPL